MHGRSVVLQSKKCSMNLRIISWYTGVSLLLVCALMCVAGLIAFFTPGDTSAWPLFCSALITGIAGAFPMIFVRRKNSRLSFREGNCVVVLSWLLACLFGMSPFVFYGGEFGPVNAFFESVSGFTTTGASILNDIESLPKGLLFWRVSTAWIGGIGIVTLFSRVMSQRPDRPGLSAVEVSAMAFRKVFSVREREWYSNMLLVTYLFLTLLAFLGLKLTGMGWFDAITNAMSACSTCGFCVRNQSIAYYADPAVEGVLMAAMIAAATHFGLIFLSILRGRRGTLLRSETFRFFVISLAVATLLVAVDLRFHGVTATFGQALRNASFQVVSLSTTTGFATQDTTTWPYLSIFILIICSLICGCSGSTSGGMKIDRVLLIWKGLKRKASSYTTPGIVRRIRIDETVKTDAQVSDEFLFIICYFSIMILGTLVNVAGGLDLRTGMTASIACIGNVGPGFGAVGSMANYSQFPIWLKLNATLLMLLGRLEIFPLLFWLRARS